MNHNVDIFTIASTAQVNKKKWDYILTRKQKKECHFLTLLSALFSHAENFLNGALDKEVSLRKTISESMIEILVFEALSKIFLHMISRVCVYEMAYASKKKILNGETPEQRFDDFINLLMNEKTLVSLLEKYKPLKNLIEKCYSDFLQNTNELFTRLSNDFEEISKTFTGATEGMLLTNIIPSGDSHNNGKRVCILEFLSNEKSFKIVYKPRNLSVDGAFMNLMHWFSKDFPSFKHYNYKMIIKDDYGWCEFKHHKGCDNKEGIENFYYRMGALLCVSHLLCSTDLHVENIIANGEFPYIIDFECALRPVLNLKNEFRKSEIPRHLLTETIFLPTRTGFSKEHNGVDISAIGAIVEEEFSSKQMQWEKTGTDEMYLVRKSFKTDKATNFPFLNDDSTPINPVNFENFINNGFTDFYNYILDNKEILLNETSPLQKFSNGLCRVLVRSTNIYGKLLYESFHPLLLHDDTKRIEHFKWLFNNSHHLKTFSNHAKFMELEIKDLLTNNIPYFFCNTHEREIFGTGMEHVDVAVMSATDYVKNHLINYFNEENLILQNILIENSFIAFRLNQNPYVKKHGNIQNKFNPPVSYKSEPDYESLKKTALEISKQELDRISKFAIKYDNYITWSCLELVGINNYNPQYTNNDIYDGCVGIFLTFGYASKIYNNQNYNVLAKKILDRICSGISDEKKHFYKSLGAYNGIGGILYALSAAHKFMSDPHVQDLFPLVLKWSEELTEADETFDIISGSAGFIVSLIHARDYISKDYFLSLLKLNVNKIVQKYPNFEQFLSVQNSSQKPLLGISHGVSGMAWALSKANYFLNDEKITEWIKNALSYERSFFNHEKKSWLDLRESDADSPESNYVNNSWCHGAPGLAMSKLGMQEYFQDDFFENEINLSVDMVLNNPFETLSLCHGDLGNHDFLLETYLRNKSEKSRKIYLNYTEKLIMRIRENRDDLFIIKGTLPYPGLMLGRAGVAYQMMRIAEPQFVPSILLI